MLDATFFTYMLVFFGAWLGTILMLVIAPKINLMQAPNHRSSHSNIIPHGGGLALALAAGLGMYCIGEQNQTIIYLLLLSIPLAVIGLADDIFNISARWRFLLQIIVVISMVAHMWPIYGLAVDGFPMFTIFMLCVTILTGAWWVNLFNFMDGIDGITCSQTVSMISSAAILMGVFNPDAIANPIWLSLWILVFAAFGFLMLNWVPAKIFMGDVGTLWLGFIIFGLALMTINEGWMHFVQWLIVGVAYISDSTITLITRMLRGDRWYEAHRTHVFQRYSRYWASGKNESKKRATGQRKVVLSLIAINLFWCMPWLWLTFVLPSSMYIVCVIVYAPIVAFVIKAKAGMPEEIV